MPLRFFCSHFSQKGLIYLIPTPACYIITAFLIDSLKAIKPYEFGLEDIWLYWLVHCQYVCPTRRLLKSESGSFGEKWEQKYFIYIFIFSCNEQLFKSEQLNKCVVTLCVPSSDRHKTFFLSCPVIPWSLKTIPTACKLTY